MWAQEEPKNIGAWTFVQPRLRKMLNGARPVRYVGKPARPSPAQGSQGFHKKEHNEIVRAAFKGAEDDTSKEDTAERIREKTPVGD